MLEPTLILNSILSFMPILFFDGLFSDMSLVLKIFVMMTIFGYVTQHLGKGPLAVLIILGMGYFILFDQWKFFGGIYVLYVLVLLGIGGVVVDFMFITPSAHGANPGGQVSNGKDFMARQSAISKLRK
jgi:hypothetical protein